MAEDSHNWIRKILGSTSEGRPININLGNQGDIVTGVGGCFIKDVHGNIIKDARFVVLKFKYEGNYAIHVGNNQLIWDKSSIEN